METTDAPLDIRLLRYKDQAEAIVDEYRGYKRARFTIEDDINRLADGADVVVSCITDARGILVEDESLFKPGCLVVPVHTKGFQNLDRIFDHVIADDTGHVCHFGYFAEFRKFHEFGDILSGRVAAREQPTDRILSYNIGLGLHDAVYASKIYDMVKDKPHREI